MTFTERVENLCKDKGITIGKMLSDLELAKGAFTNWKTRGTIPGGDILVKISNYFEVSVDFLLGIKKDRPEKGQPLSELCADLSREEFDKVIAYVASLKSKRNS